MTLNRIRYAILCLSLFTLAACLGTVALRAQTSTEGSIAGTVLDQSGATVGGAAVTIHNIGTNAEINLTTNSHGLYNAPLLEPGSYKVTISAPGFAAYHADNVIVLVGQVTTLLPHLTVASSSTQVVVTEQNPAMNLESPSFTDTLNTRALQQIPINNKRWSALSMTTPGVVADSSGFGLVSIRGISTLLNNVEIDGADDNNAFYSEERGRTREAYSTSFAAVREFAVNSGVYSSQYGRAAGGVITSVTKSGANQLHGQAYFWDRESNWAAYNPYSTITNFVDGANVTTPFKPKDLRKIYGFTVGGALIKSKLFWMYTYDQHTHINPQISVPYNNVQFYTLPSATLAAGETCNLANGNLTGAPAAAINDINACALAARQGAGHGTVSYAQAAYDWTGLMEGSANVTLPAGVTAITDLGLLSDMGESPRSGYQEINMPKLDWQINQKNHLSVLYNRLRWDAPGDVQTNTPDMYGRDTNGNDHVKLDYGVTTLTSMITPSISNQVLYQYSRELEDEGQQPYTDYTKADLTSSTGNVPQVETGYNYGVEVGSPYYEHENAFPEENKWQASDIVYWNKGKHELTFGGELVHNYDMTNDLSYSNGNFSYDWVGNYFNDLLNYKNGVTPSSTNKVGCDSYASENYVQNDDFSIVGDIPCYYEFEQGFGPASYAIATLDTGLFFQDNWRFSPRLTLNLGLRWDKETIPGPSSNFISATGSFVPYVGLANNPSENRAFGPRIGFAYNVFGSGKTVLHGGWGMYYGRINNGNIEQARFNTGSPNGQYVVPWYYNSSPTGPFYQNLETSGALTAKPTSYFMAPNLKLPEVQEFDLAVQHELGKGTVFQVSYLGALGRELPNYLDVNLNPTTTTKTLTVTDDPNGVGKLGANGSTISVPVFTGYGNTSNPELNVLNGSGSAASGYQEIGELISNINSNYNALVVEILNRSLHSLQFDANYTWSHALDYSQNADVDTTGAYNGNWYNPYGNARVNYGNSSWDVPNRFVAYALYNFPGVKSSNPLKWVVNGWSINDSFQMQNGLPFTAGVSNKPTSAIGSGLNGSGGSSVIPGIGVNTYRYPRHVVDDARLQKNFAFQGGYKLELSLDAYNLANHKNVTGFEGTYLYYASGTSLEYNGPGSSETGGSDFMVPNAANNSGFLYTPREIEIIARFNF
jgi:hypothetical protein